MSSDAWLYNDIIRGAVEYGSDTVIKVSSQANPEKYPLNRSNVEGSAKYTIKGSYTAPDILDLAIKISALGEPGSDLSGVNSIPTIPLAGKNNHGDGTCTVMATTNTESTFDLTLRCINAGEESAGNNAYVDSSDYTAEVNQGGIDKNYYGGRYINNRTGEEGSAGNGGTVKFSKSASGDPHPWITTDLHVLTDESIETDEWWLKFDVDPTADLSEGDLIQFGASDEAHVLLKIYEDNGGDWWGAFWPRSQSVISTGTIISKVASTAGYKIDLTSADGSITSSIYGYSLDGGTTDLPIRNLLDIWYALNDGKGTNDHGIILTNFGYEIKTDTSATIYQQPPRSELLTFANGASTGTYAVFSCESSQDIWLETFYADGTQHTLGAGGIHELKINIDPGDIAYSVGDKYTLQIIQAQCKVSYDGESSWSTAIDVNDGGTGDQDYVAEIDIGHSITLRIELSEDDTPFVLNDKLLSVMGYRNGWRRLADNLRSGKYRTRICATRQAILIDLGTGNTEEVDYLALIDHNIQQGSNKIKFLGISDSDIETCYGETTGLTYDAVNQQTTILVTPESAPGTNDHQGGYFTFVDGDAQGHSYSIVSNTATQYIVSGACASDGADSGGGEEYIIIPPDSYADFVANDVSVTDDDYHGNALANLSSSSFTGRGFIIVFDDSANPDGYIEMSFCLLGKRMIPGDENGNAEAHNYIAGLNIKADNIEMMNEAGEFIHGTKGVGSKTYPLEYAPVSTNCKDQLKSMAIYCNNYNRAIPAAFWADTSSRNDIIIGYIKDMTITTSPQSIGGIHSVEFDLISLETE